MFGKQIQLLGLQQYLSIVLGVLVVVIALFPALRFIRVIRNQTTLMVSKVKSALGQALGRRSTANFFVVGFLNGLLPCGMVYVALFSALAYLDVYQSIGFMAMFGLGTIPLMTVLVVFAKPLFKKISGKVPGFVLPSFVALIGVFMIMRGMGLGIPYISPTDHIAVEQVSNAHSCH